MILSHVVPRADTQGIYYYIPAIRAYYIPLPVRKNRWYNGSVQIMHVMQKNMFVVVNIVYTEKYVSYCKI